MTVFLILVWKLLYIFYKASTIPSYEKGKFSFEEYIINKARMGNPNLKKWDDN